MKQARTMKRKQKNAEEKPSISKYKRAEGIIFSSEFETKDTHQDLVSILLVLTSFTRHKVITRHTDKKTIMKI